MMGRKAKRKREWKSNTMKVPEHLVVRKDPNGVVLGTGDDREVAAFIDWIYQWARDMQAWGQDVRDDIIRLEGRAGFASGDPGDPPDGPPNGDE
jgi:hypothetical protein